MFAWTGVVDRARSARALVSTSGPVAIRWVQTVVATPSVSIEHTKRPAEAGILPSVGSVGDSCDNALAQSVTGLFKTEVIRHLGPWRNIDAVELATLERVAMVEPVHPLEPIGSSRLPRPKPATTPRRRIQPWPRSCSKKSVFGKPGTVHRARQGRHWTQRCPGLDAVMRLSRSEPGPSGSTPNIIGRQAVEHYAGIDLLLE
jgi:hypothetical protein